MRLLIALVTVIALILVTGSHAQPPFSDLKSLLNPQRPAERKVGEAEWKEEFRLDLDDDGQPNAVVESLRGRGPLSTYTVRLRLRALPGTHFLRDGLPVASGTTIRIADFLRATDTVDLCRMGGSLRTPQQSNDELNGGPWWNRERGALGVAVVRGTEVRIGYTLLSVSRAGAVKAHPGRLQLVEAVGVEVKRH